VPHAVWLGIRKKKKLKQKGINNKIKKCHYVRQGKSPDDSLYSSTVALLEIDSQGPCAAIETADSSK
jgi:hypothetical protein